MSTTRSPTLPARVGPAGTTAVIGNGSHISVSAPGLTPSVTSVGGERLAVAPNLDAFAATIRSGRDPAESLETFDRAGAMSETLYLGLRTREGVDDMAFRARFGCGVAVAFPEALRRAGERLALVDGHWRFDRAGWLLYDHLITPFL